MNTLGFKFLASSDSNDHQVRILVDGQDWLGDEYLGIDPPEFFSQRSLVGGPLLVGRCDCGVVGCGDLVVQVVRQGDGISWTKGTGSRLEFDYSEYTSVIDRASTDFSWEDVNRTAERFVNGEFHGTTLAGGYIFDWASARVRRGVITLSFSQGGGQKLLEFPWNGRSADDALAAARAFHARILSHPPLWNCSRCGLEKSEFAEDLDFVVLDVEDYKRITALSTGWPSGAAWEIEGWRVSEAGRYRSAVCADCAMALAPMMKKRRLTLVGLGLFFLTLSPISIALIDKIPVVGFFGGWFLFPVAGIAALIMAHQLNKKSVVMDRLHRKAWRSGGGKVLHASYGMWPRQKGVQMRFLVPDWEKVRAGHEEERRASGWSHFIITRHSTLSADDRPTVPQTLESFGAKHMGEVMDAYPHKKK
jgi:hypothetical protein